ncbi:MAG TPA: 30S ribosomal protein S17e [Candidatus Nanoarchaeia archaeon]|nr:30S ribosomal protein S17e [Candidatus Nanoarchaeia archaeon]
MGRIKTAQIKRVTRQLINNNAAQFSTDFKSNQAVVGKLISTPSKRLRNKVTGYVTKMTKQRKENA